MHEERGEEKASVGLHHARFAVQAYTQVSYCVPITQCHQQLLTDAFVSAAPVLPALHLLKRRPALLACEYSTELARQLGRMSMPSFLG